MKSTLFDMLKPGWQRYRLDLAVALGAALVVQIVGVAMPLAARAFMNQDITTHSQAISLTTILIALSGLALLRIVATWQQVFRGERLAQRMLQGLRSDLYAHLQTLPFGYFERRPLGKLLIRFVGDANALRSWIAKTSISIPVDVLVVLLILGLVAYISPMTWAAALLPLAIGVPIVLLLNPRIQYETRRGRRALSKLSGRLDTHLSNIAEIKVKQRYAATQHEIDADLCQLADTGIRRGRLEAAVQAFGQGGASLSLAAVLATGVWLLQNGSLAAGDVMALVWLVILLRGPVSRLVRANTAYQKASVSAERFQRLMDREPEPGRGAKYLPEDTGSFRLEFDRVGYRDLDGRWILRHFSANFQGPGLYLIKGDHPRVARTVLELVLRLRRPHEGRLKLSNQSIRRFNVDALRGTCAWIRSIEDFQSQDNSIDQASLWLMDFSPESLVGNRSSSFVDRIRSASHTKLVLLSGVHADLVEHTIEILNPGSENNDIRLTAHYEQAALS